MINNTFSKFEQKIVKVILEYKRPGIESTFKELFEYLLNKFFPEIGIEINKLTVTLYFYKRIETEKIIITKERVYELFLLFKYLKENYNFFYDIPKNAENFKHCFDKNKSIIDTQLNMSENFSNILNLIYSNYFISSDLRDLKDLNFNSIERKDLIWTKWALVIGTFFSFISCCLECYQLFLESKK